MVQKLQREFDVEAVELAADRGMFCEKNLQLLGNSGISYVVGGKAAQYEQLHHELAEVNFSGVSGPRD